MKLFKSLLTLSALATISFVNANDFQNLQNSLQRTIAVLEKKELSAEDVANFAYNFKKANDLLNDVDVSSHLLKEQLTPAYYAILNYMGFVSPLYDVYARQELNPLLYFKKWREQNSDELNYYINNVKNYINYLSKIN